MNVYIERDNSQVKRQKLKDQRATSEKKVFAGEGIRRET